MISNIFKMIKHAVILAGGNGARFFPQTKDRSKAMVLIDRFPLITYSLAQLAKVHQIFITVGPFKTELISYCYHKFGVANYIMTEGRGNCWWIFNSIAKDLDCPVLVLPCDLITELDTLFLYNEYKRLNSPPIMHVPILWNGINKGDFIESKNYLVKKLSKDQKLNLFCSGIQVINPSLINSLLSDKKHIENFEDLWDIFITTKQLYHSDIYPHIWYSINSNFEKNHFLKNRYKYYVL